MAKNLSPFNRYMKTIITVIPEPIERSSRALKQSASLTRFEYRSIVIEGERSNNFDSNLLFELESPALQNPVTTKHHGTIFNLWESIIRRIKKFKRPDLPIFSALAPLFWYFDHSWRNYILPTLRIGVKHPARLYYLHGFEYFPAVYILCLIQRARYIYDAHDYYADLVRKTIKSPLWMNYYLWLERLCVKNAAACVTVNNSLANLLREEFGRDFIVIRNCHDVRLDTSVVQDIRKTLNLSSDDFIMVCVGHNKDFLAIEQTIQSMVMLPTNVHLAFVGNNYESHREMTRQLDLADRVHYIDAVKATEVVPFIRTADLSLILYYPSSSFVDISLPNKFFQSIAAGLPLLYPDLMEIKTISEQYQLGIQVDPLSSQSISDAVISLYSNRSKMMELKRNLQKASEEINWEKEEILLKKIVDNILISQS
ncbi:MAG: glycosyltransferase [Anaerolineales bacterium]|nr:glycosyltransferase [Anaerolineales bacterium]